MRYLTAAEVLDLSRRIGAQPGGVVSEGEERHDSFIESVAAQAFVLIRQDKRLGHAVLEVTLYLNGIELSASVHEQERVILSVAAGTLSREAFTEWVNRNVEEVRANLVRRHFPLTAARMTPERAAAIRALRTSEEGCSWRGIAEECHHSWGSDASWDPPSNQIAGMELCEAAAALLGEHYLSAPWN